MKLKRELGLLETTFYGVGVILGAGIYAIIGEAAGLAGNALWLSFVLGAFIATFTGLSFAELATMFPKASGEYIYVRKAFGSRFLAFLVGWLIIFSGVVSAAAVSLGFAGYFEGLTGKFFGIDKNSFTLLTAISLVGILSYINFFGIKESSRFNIIFTLIEIAGLLIIIAIGIQHFGKVNYLETPTGLSGIFSAAALIFFAYIGFEGIVKVVEETKEPRKTIPRALIFAITITTLLYILVSISSTSLVSWKELGASPAPLALVASKVFGSDAYLIISLIALFATANTVLIILLASTRMLYGMAMEKSLPEELALLHSKTRIPWIATLITAFLSILFILPGNIKVVANITNLFVFITFTAVNLSLIWFRFMMPKMKRAFRVPLNLGNYPITAFLAIFFNLFMIFQFELNLIIFGLVIMLVGAILYFCFRKLRVIE